MNSDCRISKSDFINLKNEINKDGLGKIKNLSQKERKILKVAIDNFNSGIETVIPETLANKLSKPSTYEKNIFNSIGKAFDKAFSRSYIDSNELSKSLNSLHLDDSVEELEAEAKLHDIEANKWDKVVERLEAEVRRLEKELEKRDF